MSSSASSSAPPTGGRVKTCDHIKKLPDADRAASMLQELKRHAEPILLARGWRVTRLYEMCCCTAGGKNLAVGGFCVAKGDRVTAHRIALRLREPTSHVLYDFDRCMSVLLHELSHIVHGNHSASFYQLMAELVKDHESFLRRGVVLDDKNMPVMGGRKLDPMRHNPAAADAVSTAHLAAVERAKKQRVMGGGRLGGGAAAGPGGGGRAASSALGGADWRKLRPGEMALRAAAARLQAWDAEHGLGGDELEASQAAEEEEIREGQGTGGQVEAVEHGGGQPPRDGQGLCPPTREPGLFLGGRAAGRARWVSRVPCAGCSPDCREHGAAPPPPQDSDEGGGAPSASGASAAPRVAAASAVTCQPAIVGLVATTGAAAAARDSAPASATAGGRAVFVDLTCSDDEADGVFAAGPAAPAVGAPQARRGGASVPDHSRRGTRAPPAQAGGMPSLAPHMPLHPSQLHRPAPPPQPPHPARVRRWDCRACTLSNPPSTERCEACDTWRYARPPAEERATLAATFSTRYFTT